MTSSSSAPGRRWPAAAGAWLGIGTAPAALVLGAQMGARHGGDLPVAALAIGGATMVVLLAALGRLGLLPPTGENAALSALTPRYLPPLADRTLAGLLAVAMIGWTGVNMGLGGAALSTLIGVPEPAAATLLAVPVAAVGMAGVRRWNAVAIVTTGSAVILVGLVLVRLAPPSVPLTVHASGIDAVAASVAGFVGYVAVFAVRAPDFSVGLRSRRDLAWCIGLLVAPALAATVIGAGVRRSTGSSDIVATLAGPGGLAIANLFVAVAVVAPTFTATYSGGLALRRMVRLPEWAAALCIAAPGLALAAVRLDRMLLDWLGLLAAALPVLIPPMAAEAARRRRGRPPRRVPSWTWAPAAAIALALVVAGYPGAPFAGLVLATAATLVQHGLRGLRERRRGTARPHGGSVQPHRGSARSHRGWESAR